jgi:hypothetical protein
LLTETEAGFVLQFNYTASREYFDILRLESGLVTFNYSLLSEK